MKKELRTRMYGWWFMMIAAGFALLALNACLIGAPVKRIVMYCGIGVVFLVTAVLMLRPKNL